jgi:hypothetical protein
MPGRLQPINQEAHERSGSHARKSLPRPPLAAAWTFCGQQGVLDTSLIYVSLYFSGLCEGEAEIQLGTKEGDQA